MEEGLNKAFIDTINGMFGAKRADLKTYSPLTLAYVGDAVYDLVVRTLVVEHGNTNPALLHKESVKYVSARAQSAMIDVLMPMLTEEEQSYYRRGKNGKPHTSAKNATITEYHRATGFETLMGYLYLSGQTERMLTLMKIGIDSVSGKISGKVDC